MYDYSFRRVEEKYLLSKKQRDLLLKRIDSYIKEDKYYDSTICNVYFDTMDHQLIIHSLEKPMYKEKIRLRSYQVPSLEDDVFLEIKCKYQGVVHKRRMKLKLKDFYDYLEHGTYPKSHQVMKELDYLFKFYGLVPSYFIAYDRKSYCGVMDPNLRITIDSNLRSRREDLHLELGDAGKRYFKKDYYIMEIKTLESIPLWLVHILSELKIFPTSFSKYGSIYQKEEVVYAE